MGQIAFSGDRNCEPSQRPPNVDQGPPVAPREARFRQREPLNSGPPLCLQSPSRREGRMGC
eukprot:7515212-Alexandrium_andersonii.AAC.1